MIRKIKTMLKSTSGNVAILTAILAFPLFGAAGAALDYSNYINLRNDIQSALDAAGLAAGAEFVNGVDTARQLETYAEDFFESNLPDGIKSDEYVFNFQYIPAGSPGTTENDSRIRISATVNYETIFGTFIGVDTMSEEILSIISLGNRTVEVALVLDNSGSMRGSRISSLRDESHNLVNTIFNSSNLIDIDKPVQFSVVPFAGMVNVGTDNDDASWMDVKGWSETHHENLNWETFRTNNAMTYPQYGGEKYGVQENSGGQQWRTRFDVFDMLNTNWAGCVEMRPYPYNIQDDVSDNSDSFSGFDESNKLFVPHFAPDEPDRTVRYRNYFGRIRTGREQTSYRNDYLYDLRDINATTNVERELILDISNGSDDNEPLTPFSGTFVTQYGNFQLNRTNWLFKYQANERKGNYSSYYGPNYGCTANPITPLTENQTTITNAINAMQANGATNIQQGLTWGWRTLSPGEPYTGGREPDPENVNLKIIILLSDGNNFYSLDNAYSSSSRTNNYTGYGAWGYSRPDTHHLKNPLNGRETHSRWLDGLESTDLNGTIYENTNIPNTPNRLSEFEVIMNAHTNQACRNIKNDGVSIYTIAFDVPSSGGVRDLLEACAGSGIDQNNEEIIRNSQFYYNVNGSELDEAFEDIARQISNLRIAG